MDAYRAAYNTWQEKTEWVLKEYIDHLEVRCTSLAAENAGLKQTESNLVRNIINDLGDTEFQYSRVQTPATDAFLAEVRASGVEMFAAVLRRKGDDAFFDAIAEAQANAADQFAAQLRQEGAQ